MKLQKKKTPQNEDTCNSVKAIGILGKIQGLLFGQESEYQKRIVSKILGHSIVWVYLSYLLAFLDRPTIAEDLAKAVIAGVISVVLVYALKSMFENLSKHNNWPDKPIVKIIDEITKTSDEVSDSDRDP
jgi:hypothetical protein